MDLKPNFKIVLLEPEIPQNTGTIGRMCLATGSELHLVKPLGFDIDEKAVRRAGLDYWKHLRFTIHESIDEFFHSLPTDAEIVLVENKTDRLIYDYSFRRDCYLIFGKETTGIPDRILKQNPNRIYKIPMFDDRVRSLNLSNCVSIVTYEGIRQLCKSIR